MNKNVKEKIIDATTELIGECASIESVTVRDIAAKASVGIGLINYHFQTKENLINQCVQKMIGNTINNFDKLYQSLTMEPLDKLRFLTKRMCLFLARNQGISRVSILSDLFAGNCSDNTSQTIKAYLPVMREVCGNKKSDKELYLLSHILMATLQSAFLRRDVFMQSAEVDFYDVEQLECLIDRVIDILFK
jgi:AcrR family transcriptional regulator